MRALIHPPEISSASFIFSRKGMMGRSVLFTVSFHCFSNCSVKAKYFFPSSLVELASGSPWVRTQNNTKSRDAKSFIIRVVVRKQVRDQSEKTRWRKADLHCPTHVSLPLSMEMTCLNKQDNSQSEFRNSRVLSSALENEGNDDGRLKRWLSSNEMHGTFLMLANSLSS
ncbi:hypothetical protein CDAR_225611 [Caerostris darwini]|uniref:Uncharacterized protein n=1 Tax=Caerostris darwini TaxID=1538125 RepID=A0AAV4UE29_9ARAC|nr:hypothetical protein CDAR_225611 [Caerostris darwini]